MEMDVKKTAVVQQEVQRLGAVVGFVELDLHRESMHK